MNRYFIVEKSNPNYDDITDYIVNDELRESLDGSKVVVKLPIGDEDNHACLNGVTEYTHEEIKLEVVKIDWQDNEDI